MVQKGDLLSEQKIGIKAMGLLIIQHILQYFTEDQDDTPLAKKIKQCNLAGKFTT